MQRVAAFDIGSNSILCLVADLQPDGTFVSISDLSEVAQLARDADTDGNLAPASVDRAIAALQEQVARARAQGARSLVAAGTECLRAAPNAGAFVSRVESELGLRVDVVTGEEEARLAYLGVRSGLADHYGDLLLVDIGGASTELAVGSAEELTARVSLPVGAVRLADRVPSDDASVALAELNRITNQALVGALAGVALPEQVAGVGGTATALAALHHALPAWDAEVVEGTVLRRSEVEGWATRLLGMPLAARRGLGAVDPRRGEVLHAGAAILARVLGHLDRDTVTVTVRGLRHGLVADRFR